MATTTTTMAAAMMWPSSSYSSPSSSSPFVVHPTTTSLPLAQTSTTTAGSQQDDDHVHWWTTTTALLLSSNSASDGPHHIIRHHPDPPAPPLDSFADTDAPSPSPLLSLLSSAWLANNFEPVQAMLSWLLNGPLTLLFVLSGIALNALCVLVFLRFRNTGGAHTTPIIHYYLISLACWHSALLCNAFVLYCLPTLLWGSVVSTGPYVHLYPPTYTLANATHTGTVWIILALTLDRYLALCMPFKHRVFSKRSRVKRLVVGLSALAIVFSLPRFFEVTTAFECTTPTDAGLMTMMNGTTMEGGNEGGGGREEEVVVEDCMAYVQRTELPQNQLYRSLYHILLGSTFVTILPGVLTFVLTLRITIALSEAQRRRKRLSHCEPMRSSGETKTTTTTTTTITTTEKESHSGGRDTMENSGGGTNYNNGGTASEKQQYRTLLLGTSIIGGATATKKPSCLRKKEHRANVMLVVVIVKFLISDILPTVLDVFETFIGNEAFMSSPVATLWVDFSNLLLVLNCSTNFWVFIFYVRGFRHRCARLLAISLRLSPAHSPPITMDGNESAFVGSGFASPRPSMAHCMIGNGTNGVVQQQGMPHPGYRPRGSAGEYTELAKSAMLNSSSVAPILSGTTAARRDSSLQSLNRVNGANANRGESPPGGSSEEANGGKPTTPIGLFHANMRSKRASSLGMAQQQQQSNSLIGVTITPPPPLPPSNLSSASVSASPSTTTKMMMANGNHGLAHAAAHRPPFISLSAQHTPVHQNGITGIGTIGHHWQQQQTTFLA